MDEGIDKTGHSINTSGKYTTRQQSCALVSLIVYIAY